MGTDTGRGRRAQQVHAATVELVAEPREDDSLGTLKANLRNRVCTLLVLILVAAQLADVATTYRALQGQSYVENNPLLRFLLLRSPLAAYSVKLLMIVALALLALSRLRGRRAQVAIGLAAAISLIAPVMNFALLQRWG
jgi:hypothetical protein